MQICMINIHGHLKGEECPIGGHPDSGGQIVYVLNLAHYLGEKGHKVDIFTRAFEGEKWPGFDVKTEKVSNNINIIRIPCGHKHFVSKEEIWPYVGEFTRGIEEYYKKSKKNFDIISTHYADSGICGVLLKARTGKPLVHSGHSLGALKIQSAGITQGNFLSVNKRYSFHTRLFAERTTLNWADSVIVSTEDERYQQYGLQLYEGAIDVEDPKFIVIPPGVNTEDFYTPMKTAKRVATDKNAEKTIEAVMEDGIDPSRRGLPSVFMVGRLDPRRNILGLIEAYAGSKQLQELANLFISSGGLLDPTFIKNWEGMQTNYKTLLKDIRKIIVKDGIQGKIVLTDIFNYDKEYPGILRYAARHRWVYINPAIHEHRGIAVLEAMASGLPVITTHTGCSAELISQGNYGVLVDPRDPRAIAEGILSILTDENEWDRLSRESNEFVIKNYSWSLISTKIEKLFKEIVSRKGTKDSKYVLLPPRYLRKPSDKSEKDLIDDLRTFLFNVAEGKRQASKVSRDLADLIIDELTVKDKKPFVFAMAGETGAGKTTIANKLSRTLNNLGYESVIFKMEDYLVELPRDMVEKRVTKGSKQTVGPDEIDIKALNEHVETLLNGETVTSPVINVKANSRKLRIIRGSTLFVIIIEGVYCDRLNHVDMLTHFDIDFNQLREQRYKKEDVVLYPKDDSARTLLEDITRIEHDYLENTDIKTTADLKINGRYEILYRTPSQSGLLI